MHGGGAHLTKLVIKAVYVSQRTFAVYIAFAIIIASYNIYNGKDATMSVASDWKCW